MTAESIVIAPDSFKGSLTASQVAEAIATGLARRPNPPATHIMPMADGGEGLLDAIAHNCDGQWQQTQLTGIHGYPVTACWYVLADGTAVLESATVIGLPLIESVADAPTLARRSSYALGQLMQAALDQGARRLAIGLGGSACNDAGLGMLVALGARAYDDAGNILPPSMNGLLSLAQLDTSTLDARLQQTHIRVLCDVDNPLLGETGATRVYGPQKGLTHHDIQAVETGFQQLAAQCRAHEQMHLTGSGAAGGLGFALAVLGGRLESGAQAVFELTDLDRQLQDASHVITGEGRCDLQTLAGKLPLAVARAARPTPTTLISGDIDPAARPSLDKEFAATVTLVEKAGSIEAALAEPVRWLTAIARTLELN